MACSDTVGIAAALYFGISFYWFYYRMANLNKFTYFDHFQMLSSLSILPSQ